MNIIEKIEKEQIKRGDADFNVGDSVKVYTRVKEGDKERTQMLAGIVISRKGNGMREQFTLRRITHGEGVERVFPLNSPAIEKIVVENRGKVRRSKLYYLRHKKGAMVVKAAFDKEAENKA